MIWGPRCQRAPLPLLSTGEKLMVWTIWPRQRTSTSPRCVHLYLFCFQHYQRTLSSSSSSWLIVMLAVLRIMLGPGCHFISLRPDQDCQKSRLAWYQYCSSGSSASSWWQRWCSCCWWWWWWIWWWWWWVVASAPANSEGRQHVTHWEKPTHKKALFPWREKTFPQPSYSGFSKLLRNLFVCVSQP